MKMILTITVDLDVDLIALEAKRAGFNLERTKEAILSDLENRAVDAIRWRDCVAHVGSVVHTSEYRPQEPACHPLGEPRSVDELNLPSIESLGLPQWPDEPAETK